MNTQQLTGIIKPFIAAAVAYLAGRGLLFDANTWNIILSSAVTIALAVWSGWQNTNTNLVKNVDALAKQSDSPVQAIIVERTKAGNEMANSMPGNTTVVAGTAAARSASEEGSPAVKRG